MKNKFIAGLLALAMLCTLNTSVVKADNEFTETGNQSVPVTCDITATFTVRLPASFPLTKDGSDYKFTGSIGVKGDLASGGTIGVAPTPSVTMYDVTQRPGDKPTPIPTSESDQDGYSHKDAVVATVTQSKQSWTNLEINSSSFTEQPIIVDAGALQAATWKGLLPFTISYNAGSPTP